MLKLKLFPQKYSYDCGGAVLYSILQSYNLKQIKTIKEYKKFLKEIHCGKFGLSTKNMIHILNKYGLNPKLFKFAKYEQLYDSVMHYKYPVIVAWHSLSAHAGHYSIVVDISSDKITLLDPNFKRKININIIEFRNNWFVISPYCSKSQLLKNPEQYIDMRLMIVIRKSLL